MVVLLLLFFRPIQRVRSLNLNHYESIKLLNIRASCAETEPMRGSSVANRMIFNILIQDHAGWKIKLSDCNHLKNTRRISKGLRLKRRNYSCIFQVPQLILINRSFVLIRTTYTGTDIYNWQEFPFERRPFDRRNNFQAKNVRFTRNTEALVIIFRNTMSTILIPVIPQTYCPKRNILIEGVWRAVGASPFHLWDRTRIAYVKRVNALQKVVGFHRVLRFTPTEWVGISSFLT
jgi:hypothetical protein